MAGQAKRLMGCKFEIQPHDSRYCRAYAMVKQSD
jgi:hypothetical protein